MLTSVAPRSIEEAADCVRAAARERATVLVSGGGTKRSWIAPAQRVDLELSTRALSGVVAYEPGDGVITALAGTPWRELERLVARHGHHLSPRIPIADRATVGGVIAAGQSGMDRLRFGPLRDHVLGVRVVTAEGRIVRTGGRLVKNVTGFDLHRLHTGAHGSLGMIAEASLRLHAAPELQATCVAQRASADAALEFARAILRSSRAAWHVSVANAEAPRSWSVHARIAGSRGLVESEVASLAASSPDGTWHITRPSEHPGDEPTAVDRSECDAGAWPSVRITCPPADVGRVLAALGTALASTDVVARNTVQPALGVIDARLQPLDALRIERVTAEMTRLAARVHWRGLDEDLRARVDVWGGVTPPGSALMRRIRANLDPYGLWAAGRLAGGS